MNLSAPRARYSAVAMFLHWLIALLVALNYAAAWAAEDQPRAVAGQIMANHKAIGISILVLTVLRLLWRAMHRPPPMLPMAAWESRLAGVVHALVYLLMLGIPLAGWATHSAFTGGAPVSIFGLFDFPGLPMAADKARADHLWGALHGTLATAMLGLLALHVAGALKHQFIDRKPELQRMLPWR